MDSIVPAFIAALLACASDRPPWLVAILRDRYAQPATILLALLLAQAAGSAIAAAGALYVAPILNPNARSLLLGLSLLAAAAGIAWKTKVPTDRLEGWRLGGFLTAFLGIFILAFGDRTQFVAFGCAVAGSSPALAAIGAALGATAACVPALVLGEAGWRALPWRPIRWASAAMLGTAGLSAALAGLRIL